MQKKTSEKKRKSNALQGEAADRPSQSMTPLGGAASGASGFSNWWFIRTQWMGHPNALWLRLLMIILLIVLLLVFGFWGYRMGPGIGYYGGGGLSLIVLIVLILLLMRVIW
jgi:hypothetical protein